MSNDLNVPLLLLIYNRPDTTVRVFEQIKRCKPSKLFIAADGPREDSSGDKERCNRAREIVRQIDWQCEVKTLFREKNLGCKTAVSGAINWFFENVEEGIILEDDCLPHISFFRFCEELLERYRDDERIMMISGDNVQFGRRRTKYSYYFSRYTHNWGWAIWKRAWKHYDIDMKLWPEIRNKELLFDILDNKKEVSYWKKIFDKTYKGQIDAWSYQWLFACWLQNGLIILPEVNLVSNIGFENSATHTKYKSKLTRMESTEVTFPLTHAPYIIRNVIADRFTEKSIFSSLPIHKKMIDRIFHFLLG